MNDIMKKSMCVVNFATKHLKLLLTTAAGIATTSFLVFAFFQYQTYRLEKGYDYAATIQKYIDTEIGTKTKISDFEAIQFNSQEEKWNTVEKTSIEAQNNYGNTKLSGVFYAFQAEAALELGKKEEAITLFKKASNSTTDASLAAQYNLSAQLLLLDNQETKQNALAELKNLASQKNLPAHALALYYLGEYAWNQKTYTDAQNYWSQLIIETQSDKGLIDLELIAKAKTKLKLMKA